MFPAQMCGQVMFVYCAIVAHGTRKLSFSAAAQSLMSLQVALISVASLTSVASEGLDYGFYTHSNIPTYDSNWLIGWHTPDLM